jgi:hypothetical protein
MEHLLAKIDSNQAEMKALRQDMDADREEMKAERKADREEMLAKMESDQGRTESAQEEMFAKMDTHQEKMEATIHSMRAWRNGTTACQETTEAHLEYKGSTSEDMESGTEDREVSKEDTEVETGRALKKRHRIQNLAPEHRRRGTTLRAGVARRRVHVWKNQLGTKLQEEPLKD